MEGSARAPGAGTVLNALANGVGSAFAIGLETTATVSLSTADSVTGQIEERPDAETTLIEECVALTIDRWGPEGVSGGTVTTTSEVPMASGLKSSSAAANATVLATLDALGIAEEIDRLEATRVGVEAAKAAGVTVTGAFDDATASMLGGVTITDNSENRLLSREEFEYDVAIFMPPERSYSSEANVNRCARVAPLADVIAELAKDGRYGPAMTINGFTFGAALGISTERMLEALPDVAGVSISGTGPSTVAIGDLQQLEPVLEHWESADGTVYQTKTTSTGATTI